MIGVLLAIAAWTCVAVVLALAIFLLRYIHAGGVNDCDCYGDGDPYAFHDGTCPMVAK